MYEFHRDKSRYFEMQRSIAADYVLPMVAAHLPARPWRVLEVGCAEAGVLKAFLDAGHYGVGVELESTRAQLARKFLASEIAAQQAEIRTENIYDVSPSELHPEGFDVIVLKDVIEHIPDQEKMIPRLAEFLAPGGKIFFAFPPWMMPFGGHQQIAQHNLFSKLPWTHLLPSPLYRSLPKLFKEPAHIQKELQDIRSTRITIERFEAIVDEADLKVLERKLWLFNPIYALKFGLSARRQNGFISKVPYLRNYLSTAVYYVVGNVAQIQTLPKNSRKIATPEVNSAPKALHETDRS